MVKEIPYDKKRFASDKKSEYEGKFCYDVPQGLSSGAKVGIFAVVVLLIGVFFFGGFFFGANIQRTALLSLQGNQAVPSLSMQTNKQAQFLNSTINIVAVTSDGNGAVSQGTVEIIPGNGKILFSINPFIETDTQDSVQTASQVAAQFTNQSLAKSDVIYSVENTDAQLVGGPSAGAAMTVATIAAMEGKTVRSDAAITGTINSDGTIGPVGGVMEKATVAAEKGFTIFVVPQGQKVFSYYTPVQQSFSRGGYLITRTRYVTQTTDLQTYLDQQGYKMQVVEAANISDAVKLLLK